MLSRFCLLRQKKNPPPVFNRQYQDGQNINHNQMKDTHPFYIVFQGWNVLLIKICNIQSSDLLFLVALYIY